MRSARFRSGGVSGRYLDLAAACRTALISPSKSTVTREMLRPHTSYVDDTIVPTRHAPRTGPDRILRWESRYHSL